MLAVRNAGYLAQVLKFKQPHSRVLQFNKTSLFPDFELPVNRLPSDAELTRKHFLRHADPFARRTFFCRLHNQA